MGNARDSLLKIGGIDAASMADVLKSLEPDQGNRYAPKTTRAKGAARHEQWVLTCRCIATAYGFTAQSQVRKDFLAACGIPDESEAT